MAARLYTETMFRKLVLHLILGPKDNDGQIGYDLIIEYGNFFIQKSYTKQFL